jgi:membrane protein implicated in regulation of membrane protease activity
VGPGIFLIIVGAILTFAVRSEPSFLDLQVVGLIFLVVGGVLVYVGRNGATRARKVTTVKDLSDPNRPVQTVREEVMEHDPYDRLHGELQGDLDRRRS